MKKDKRLLNIALPKGRLGERVLDIFERSGKGIGTLDKDDRKLIFENEAAGVRFFWIKPSDVTVYVERGAADIGIAGSDVIAEHEPDVYELLDLGIGVCRMCVATTESNAKNAVRSEVITVATKYPETARRYYHSLGYDID
ncbi:MAG: ATP phosphoribosyltransferase, partial [Firmicutes bacterium]|nr:ATP phosphoribosyltransferase [Bacillota bacterium]